MLIPGKYSKENVPAGWSGIDPQADYDEETGILHHAAVVRGGLPWQVGHFDNLGQAIEWCKASWGQAQAYTIVRICTTDRNERAGYSLNSLDIWQGNQLVGDKTFASLEEALEYLQQRWNKNFFMLEVQDG